MRICSILESRFLRSLFACAFGLYLFANGNAGMAQKVVPLTDIGGLHSAYVVSRDTFDRVDVQVIVLSGSYDEEDVSGIAHFLEHLVAFSADKKVLRQPRARDIVASTYGVSTVYTNSGPVRDFDKLMRLSRAVLETPSLPDDFQTSEIKIVKRETFLRERQSPLRWLRRLSAQKLYNSLRGRADNRVEDLEKLSVDSALAFHKAHYVPSNVMVIVSGKISEKDAAAKIREYFGDTVAAPRPEKKWTQNIPDPDHRVITEISSNRLFRNTLILSKFIDVDWVDTSIDLQSDFFLATELFQARMDRELILENFELEDVGIDFFMALNGDVEMHVVAALMPGVEFETALETIETAIAQVSEIPFHADETEKVRQKQAAWADYMGSRPRTFLNFLQNIGSDGLAPISPEEFKTMVKETSDVRIKRLFDAMVDKGATSIVFAKEE